jgi:hypothetical protein
MATFAEARQRAATFYDGGDYVRAAAQYKEALKIRKDHFMCRLGLAYSLMFINQPSTLGDAEKEFVAIGERRDPKEEVKRVYGLGLTYRRSRPLPAALPAPGGNSQIKGPRRTWPAGTPEGHRAAHEGHGDRFALAGAGG